jgi:hypothetical protein
MNRKFRTLDDLEENYFSEHPEQIEPYLSEIFEDFAEDGNTAALLSSLRVIARVQGGGGNGIHLRKTPIHLRVLLFADAQAPAQ